MPDHRPPSEGDGPFLTKDDLAFYVERAFKGDNPKAVTEIAWRAHKRSLASRESRLREALGRVMRGEVRHGRKPVSKGHCWVIHGSRPEGWTCLDQQRDAANPESRYGDDYRAAILRGEYLCGGCELYVALADTAPEPDE